jgi:3-phenylpropionate/cinnamic acid dioxygenase small subunit
MSHPEVSESALLELLSKQEIIDCLHRHARGIDRLDKELFLSAYHRDAREWHGSFVGSPEELAVWLWSRHDQRVAAQHYVMNHTFDFAGDVAHVETYFISPSRRQDHDEVTVVGGRYIDRFERREREWRIALRILVREWGASLPEEPTERASNIGLRSASDVSYRRPLTSQWINTMLNN